MSVPTVLFVCVRNSGTSRMAAADLVVVLGREAVVDPGGRSMVTWDTVEPSEQGVEGLRHRPSVPFNPADTFTSRLVPRQITI